MIIRYLMLLIFIPLLLLSQGNSRGTASIKLPRTAFVAATSEAFVADPLVLQSISINPANVALQESFGIVFSHTQWIADVYSEYLSIITPLKYGSLSFSLANTSIDDIELRDVPGPPIGTFNSRSTVFQLSYGVELTENIHIGISPKYLYEKIFIDDATGFGLDAGILFTPNIDGLVLGCSLLNMGSLDALRKEQTNLPTMMRIGGTYRLDMNEITYRTATSYSSQFGTPYHHICIGGEVIYNNLVSLRFGYQTGYESRSYTVGLGIHYSIACIDYAFIPFELQLGDAHIISISFIL